MQILVDHITVVDIRLLDRQRVFRLDYESTEQPEAYLLRGVWC